MKRIKISLLTLLMIFGLFSCQKDKLTNETENQAEISEDIEPKDSHNTCWQWTRQAKIS